LGLDKHASHKFSKNYWPHVGNTDGTQLQTTNMFVWSFHVGRNMEKNWLHDVWPQTALWALKVQ